jgi:hypothetical protein
MADDKSKPCYICWFLTITLAIASGKLLTDAINKGIDYFSSDKTTNDISQDPKKPDSSNNTLPEASTIEPIEKELPTIKLSPNKEITDITPSPDSESLDKDQFIKTIPDKVSPKKDIPKEEMPGYKTTLEICNFWKKEYEKDATRQSQVYMESACNRLKSYE